MAAVPAGVSERGGTARGETLGETEIAMEGGREGHPGDGQSESGREGKASGAEVSTIVGKQRWLSRKQRLLVSAGTWAWAREQGTWRSWGHERKARGAHQGQILKEEGGWSVELG